MEWIARADVPRGTVSQLEQFVEALRVEAANQNLVSKSSMDEVWARHIVDSLQLLSWGAKGGRWIDLGAGAGLPGIPIALARSGGAILIEQRRRRCAFLESVRRQLAIPLLDILCDRVERVAVEPAGTISARAYAPLSRLFASAQDLATRETIWILPKGRNARSELDAARALWHGDFRIEPSVTEAGAGIIIATDVRRRDG